MWIMSGSWEQFLKQLINRLSYIENNSVFCPRRCESGGGVHLFDSGGTVVAPVNRRSSFDPWNLVHMEYCS